MSTRFSLGLAASLVILALAGVAATAQAETKILVSSEANSLCVSPTEKGFEPTVGSGKKAKRNYKPLTKSHKGPYPDSGEACAPGTASHPTDVTLPGPGGPGEKALPYNGAIPLASWVSIAATASDAGNPPPAYYIYDVPFELSCKKAKIEGTMFADNTAAAILNGKNIGHLNFGAANIGQENFDQEGTTPHGPVGGFPFSANNHFSVGLNILQFVVLDESTSFTGLDFAATVTAECPTGKES